MTDNQIRWGSRLGVIMAVAGSAVGLGNFLRFPAQAAANGGGAFMIPYFIALLVVGIPLAWAEWSMGRYAGVRGFHSAPGIFATLCKSRWASFLGVFALIIPMMVFTYYVIIEAWCLGYAFHYLTGTFDTLKTKQDYGDFFKSFTGQTADGSLFSLSSSSLPIFVLICFALNFFLIFRGLNKGIEQFCTYALPVMIVCALIVLGRVLTLGTPDPALPDQSVAGGLNFMWQPDWGKLLLAKTWLAAAGQIFFSLSVGFGVIIVYSSYLTKKDDIALSGLTASATNEVFEVSLGGMITIPAGFIFLGAAVTSAKGFGLGFEVLPNVFSLMPQGKYFGCIWFFMLFLAAITSSLSMLQPVGAFFQEGLGLTRKGASLLLLGLSLCGSGFVLFFTAKPEVFDEIQNKMVTVDNAQGNIDFWCGTFLIVVLAFVQSIIYGWVFGAQRGQRELDEGALIKAPRFLPIILQFVTPVFLAVILIGTIYNDLGEYVHQFREQAVARYSMLVIAGGLLFFIVTIFIAIQRWNRSGQLQAVENERD